MLDLRPRLAPLIGRGEGQTTQADLARRAGIVQPCISAWLAGRRPLSLEQQILLAEALGFAVELRLGRACEPKRKSARAAGPGPLDRDGV